MLENFRANVLNDVLGQTPFDSSYKELIDQRHLRVTTRTKMRTSVAWAKLSTN